MEARKRIESGAFSPEQIAGMGDALDNAWQTAQPFDGDASLARLAMAGAIIESVEAGRDSPRDLVQAALGALAAARRAPR